MVDHTQHAMALAAQALLAGRPEAARAHYEACVDQAPRLAAWGLAVTAWLQGNVGELRERLAGVVEAAADEADFPIGFAWALEGLAMIHAGAVHEGLERQSAGLQEARRRGDGTELNAVVAIAEALLYLGRWAEARTTIAGARAAADADSPLASAVLDRLSVAIAVLSADPGAGAIVDAALEAARDRRDDLGLAWALRWHGARLAAGRPDQAGSAQREAAAVAARSGLNRLAAEALAELAALATGASRQETLAAARLHAQASGSALTELDVALRAGGAAARQAASRLAALCAPLDAAEREAFLSWPGRAPSETPGVAVGGLERLGAALTAIAAEPTTAGVLKAALVAFVEAAGAERGFLLRLSGLAVIDQVVVGAAPDAYSTSLAGRVIWTGEPLVVEDLSGEAELGQAASVEALGLRMALGMPLLDAGEVVGVMLADSREAHPGFDAATLAVARAIAAHVVVAWRTAERTEASRAREAAEAAVARVAVAAAGATALDPVLALIAQEAARALHTERLFVHL
ncbi:MAG: GAF domain-containing protein, partial [Candidatus Sericytochromatia bacterium]